MFKFINFIVNLGVNMPILHRVLSNLSKSTSVITACSVLQIFSKGFYKHNNRETSRLGEVQT